MIFGGMFLSFIGVLIPVALLVILIYLIVKRIQDKENEEFEKRDY